ncbi:hypothetical protein SLURMMXVI_120090 [Escherichia phage vB_Eco_SLUR76]|nr:hypothetical protein SLURMMXVI_120090 [Escherichia phage vB_Eco_SLUR76]VAY28149.1 hypothetical protein SLURMMXVI_30090 [Escherichia phage vB_Eco_SLUR26]
MRKYHHISLELAIALFEKYGYAVVCDGDSKRIAHKQIK